MVCPGQQESLQEWHTHTHINNTHASLKRGPDCGQWLVAFVLRVHWPVAWMALS